MPSLCNRCSMKFRCCLNYDGKPCKENRDVEPTNYDALKDCLDGYGDRQLAQLVTDLLKGKDRDFLSNLDTSLSYDDLYNHILDLLHENRVDWLRGNCK